MRLQDGWDSELRTLNETLAEKQDLVMRLTEQMNAEVAEVRKKYESKIPRKEVVRLAIERDQAIARIRETHEYPILTSSEKRHGFKTVLEAAGVLAHYWQGEEMEPVDLVRGIAGLTDSDLSEESWNFAEMLTEPNSPGRVYVADAYMFLGRAARS